MDIQNNLLTITANSSQQRLDNFLQKSLTHLPKTLIYRLIRTGQVRVNSKRAKPLQKLVIGDIVRLPPTLTQHTKPSKIITAPKDFTTTLANWIIYEDADLLILDKPPGLPVHAGSGHHAGLIELLHTHDAQIQLVHRLDKATSGCLLLAKNRQSLTTLQQEFFARQIDKTYQMAVVGQCIWQNKTLTLPITSTSQRKTQPNHANNSAHTSSRTPKTKITSSQFSCLWSSDQVSFLLAKPLTGRTHQLRIHAAHLGHPIINDNKYGNFNQNKQWHAAGLKRLCLHANQICFTHPTSKKTLNIQSEYDLFTQLKRKLPNRFTHFTGHSNSSQ